MIGWVFKTGKPLLINNLNKYLVGQELDDSLLASISDGPNIEDEDRYLKYEPFLNKRIKDKSSSFLAVPVKSRVGSIWGVLCAYSSNDDNEKREPVFSRSDLQLTQSFASTISLVIQNDRQRELGLLLIRMGQTWDHTKLYELIVNDIPKLVPGVNCSIFRSKRDSYGVQLKLVRSNREGMSGENERLPDITYKIGTGKTGFTALSHATLVINHYGPGKVAQQRIKKELQRIRSYPDDLITPLFDQGGREVGIIQLWNGSKASSKARKEFEKLSQRFKIQQEQGLPISQTKNV